MVMPAVLLEVGGAHVFAAELDLCALPCIWILPAGVAHHNIW